MSLKDNYLRYAKKLGGNYAICHKGIKDHVIASILRGSDISVSKAYEVAQALGITVEELYTGVGKTQQNSTLTGAVVEEPVIYHAKFQSVSPEDRVYVDKLIDVLAGNNDHAKVAVKTNIDFFHEHHKEKATITENYLKELALHIKTKEVDHNEPNLKKNHAS